jgi:hypothetical protein
MWSWIDWADRFELLFLVNMAGCCTSESQGKFLPRKMISVKSALTQAIAVVASRSSAAAQYEPLDPGQVDLEELPGGRSASNGDAELARRRQHEKHISEEGEAVRIEACCAAYHHDERVFELLGPDREAEWAGRATPLHAVVRNPFMFDPEWVKRLAREHPWMLHAVDKSTTRKGETPLQAAIFWRSRYAEVLLQLTCPGAPPLPPFPRYWNQ